MAKHSDDSIYRCRRFVRSGERIFTGAQVASLCVSLPLEIQAMRKANNLGPAYSAACELLLDLTMGIWWGKPPEADFLYCPRADLVNTAAIAMLAHVDRFDPTRASWRTVAKYVRLDALKPIIRASRKTDPGQDALQELLRDNWQGVYDSASATEERAPRARIVGRRVNGYVIDRAKVERELDAILAPAIVDANTQLDLFALA